MLSPADTLCSEAPKYTSLGLRLTLFPAPSSRRRGLSEGTANCGPFVSLSPSSGLSLELTDKAQRSELWWIASFGPAGDCGNHRTGKDFSLESCCCLIIVSVV